MPMVDPVFLESGFGVVWHDALSTDFAIMADFTSFMTCLLKRYAIPAAAFISFTSTFYALVGDSLD